ncbi:hypothetical protein VHEMI08277 [[Torrubiella] hemipterigena]|uniref:2EXR domain-containing protein n=1 Tax=[Torrubiella] hemipterigena TaxID=1531966 RepID=A0A0A1TCX7_9HYPO|nr:hypothetical protein VHEMI08277 [[Torrubiella] hemipterigena]
MESKAVAYKLIHDVSLSCAESHSPSAPATFSPFTRLPPELRHRIWMECMSAPRFLRIILHDDVSQAAHLYNATNQLGYTISRYPYFTVVEETSGHSSPQMLNGVSREAQLLYRQAYRVRFPIRVKGSDGVIRTKTISLTPEKTILWVETARADCNGPAILHFLHDLLAYDPKGVGVVHLAISRFMDIQSLAQIDPESLPLPVHTSLIKLLSSSIQSFYSVMVCDRELRCTLGQMTCPRAKFHRSLSVPIFCQSGVYRSLSRDYRDIKRDLEHVAFPLDPRMVVFQWNMLKAKFGQQDKCIYLGYILCCVADNIHLKPACSHRQQLLDELATEDQHWGEWSQILNQDIWGERLTRDEYTARQHSLPQVSGVWVFAQDAMGHIPDVAEMKYATADEWEFKMVKDLSGFQPELWVFEL